MSFIDCLVDQYKKGELTKLEADNAKMRAEQYLNEAKSRGLSDADAETYAIDAMVQDERIRFEAQQVKANQRIALHKINNYFKFSGLKPAKAAEKYIQTIEDMKQGVYTRFMSIITDETFEIVGPNFMGLVRDPSTFKAIVGRIVDGRYDNTKLGRIAQNLNDINRAMVNELRLNGIFLSELENYFPPLHDKARISKAGKEAWVTDIKRLVGKRTRTNPDTGKPYSDEKLTELLSDAYDGISSGHADLREALNEMGELAPGSIQQRAFSKKRQFRRFIDFDTSEAFFEYNQKYGKGDEQLASMYLENLASIATDIALAGRLGPSPTTGLKFIEQKIMSGKGTGDVFSKRYHIKKLKDHYEMLHGFGLDPDARVDAAATVALNSTRSAQLGMAGLSAIPDAGMLRSAAYLKGADANRILMFYGRALLSAGTQAKAARASYIADALTQVFLNGDRMGGNIGRVEGRGRLGKAAKVSSAAASAVNELSLLNRITRAGKEAGILETLATAADTAGTKWSDLNLFWRDALAEAGITEAQWGKLNKLKSSGIYRKIADQAHGEARFLDTGAVRKYGLDQNDFEMVDLANNIDALSRGMSMLGTNEGTIATRAIVSGKRIGMPIAGRILFQYMNFPMSVLFNHLIPHVQSIAKSPIRGTVGFADAMAVTTVLGYASIIAKDVFSGKTKPEVFDDETYLDTTTLKRAFIQGGAGSLLADALDIEYGGFRQSFWKEMAAKYTIDRPVPSAIINGLSIGKDAGALGFSLLNQDDAEFEAEFERIKSEGARYLKRHIPGGNLFYIRAAVDYAFVTAMQRLGDANFEEKRAAYLERLNEDGQDLWIRPEEGVVDFDSLKRSFGAEE